MRISDADNGDDSRVCPLQEAALPEAGFLPCSGRTPPEEIQSVSNANDLRKSCFHRGKLSAELMPGAKGYRGFDLDLDGEKSKTQSSGLTLHLPDTGRIKSATSAIAEKPVHKWTPWEDCQCGGTDNQNNFYLSNRKNQWESDGIPARSASREVQ